MGSAPVETVREEGATGADDADSVCEDHDERKSKSAGNRSKQGNGLDGIHHPVEEGGWFDVRIGVGRYPKWRGLVAGGARTETEMMEAVNRVRHETGAVCSNAAFSDVFILIDGSRTGSRAFDMSGHKGLVNSFVTWSATILATFC